MKTKKKILLALAGLSCSLTVSAAQVVVSQTVATEPAAYAYVGPNYSGYYNYTLNSAYPYVGPNYSGYYNYPFVQNNVVAVQTTEISK